MRWVTYVDAAGYDRAGVLKDGDIHSLEAGVTVLDLLDSPDGLSAAGDPSAWLRRARSLRSTARGCERRCSPAQSETMSASCNTSVTALR